MPINFNNQTGVNAGPYLNQQGYQASIVQQRYYDKLLLEALSIEQYSWSKYMLHKSMPRRMGDGINARRYVGLQADPDKLRLNKNTIEGPILKTMYGLAVSCQLQWYGNGVAINDYIDATQIDDLMLIYTKDLAENILELKDNIAMLATWTGASKVYVGPVVTDVPTFVDPTTAVIADYGPLRVEVLRRVISEFKGNKETYTGMVGTTTAGTDPGGILVSTGAGASGSITVKAPIKTISGRNYIVLVSTDTLADLQSDNRYLSTFVNGLSSASLASNTFPTQYGFTIETVENKLTAAITGTTTKAVEPRWNWDGELAVSAVIGREYAFDLEMSGEGVKMYANTVGISSDSDPYARVGYATYKVAYAAKVANSMAVYCLVSTNEVVFKAGETHAPATADKAPTH